MLIADYADQLSSRDGVQESFNNLYLAWRWKIVDIFTFAQDCSIGLYFILGLKKIKRKINSFENHKKAWNPTSDSSPCCLDAVSFVIH